MKIVRIIARLNVGGPARHVAWLTADLGPRAEYESVLVAGTVPPGEDDMSYFAQSLGVRPVIIPEMSREISVKDAVTVWKLYRFFVHERPDVVHTHTAKAGTVGRVAGLFYRWLTPRSLLGRPRRCQLVHTYHGHVFHSYYGTAKTRFFLSVEKILARVATDRIVVISPQQYSEIHEVFGVGRAAQFAVIPLGLDMNVFAHWWERRRAARAEFGVDEQTTIVGIVGRLTEIKNHELFLEAVARYKKARHEGQGASRRTDKPPQEKSRRVRFIIIGDGHLRRNLEERARALELGGEVIFAGLRDDPENFYAALDIVALTSHNEGTPLTLIEAMANARPVIASGVGGVIDLLGKRVVDSLASGRAAENDGYDLCERGIMVRPGDTEGFSRGLARLIEDEELRSAMGERGKSFVEENYSKERLVADIKNLYDGLVRPEAKAVATSAATSVPSEGKDAAASDTDSPSREQDGAAPKHHHLCHNGARNGESTEEARLRF